MRSYAVGSWVVMVMAAAGCGDNIVPGLVVDSSGADASGRDGAVDAVGDGSVVVDGRLADGGFADGGVIDGGVIDAGLIDARVVDAGLIDARVVDAGLIDAGLIDAGVIDAGTPDANPCTQLPVTLGAASTFAVLAGTGVTNTGLTVVTGDLGVWSGTAISGFGPGIVTGTQYAGTTPAMLAQASLTTAYLDAAARPVACATSVAGNLGGMTLTAGLYKSTGSIAVSSGNLTLDGGGNANAVFIFQVQETLTMTTGLKVLLINGAQARNVFWQLGTSATLGTNTVAEGTIMAGAAVSILTGATLHGRALARSEAVTLDTNAVTVP